MHTPATSALTARPKDQDEYESNWATFVRSDFKAPPFPHPHQKKIKKKVDLYYKPILINQKSKTRKISAFPHKFKN